MSDCQTLEPLLTPYVDGEAPTADGVRVKAHLSACPGCRSRVDRERAVRELLRGRRDRLAGDCVPAPLRTRCEAMAATLRRAAPRSDPAPRARGSAWRTRGLPLALAASLTLLVGGAFLYQATSRSSRVLAAELTADHVKCFAANRMLGQHSERVGVAESYLASSFGWRTTLPALAGLSLEAARPCLYGEGRAAHVMYRYGGRAVSLFMLPGTTRRNETVEVMGHEAAIWSEDGRTFVLIAQQPPGEVQRLAAAIHESLK